MADDLNTALLLQYGADLTSLKKAFDKANGQVKSETDKMAANAQKAATKIEEPFNKINLTKAFDKVIDSSKIKVLDDGAARISVFGSALEELGPAGIVAGAGIAALFEAFAGAREAAEFADGISDTANRLHVTTDALQEYRYAIRAAGGEEEGADQALEAFSVTLGKAQQGLAKSQRAFLALGFTKEQIKGFTDADDALRQITDRISGLSNQQKDAIIDQLGLTGLKPLIDAGVASMTRLREEAHKAGLVMDSELVNKGGELNDQFETLEKVIDVQLKSALVDLGPVLVGLLGIMAQMAKAANDIVNSFRSIEDKTTQSLKDRLNVLLKERNGGRVGSTPESGQLGARGILLGAASRANRAVRNNASLDAEIAKIEGLIAEREKAGAPGPITGSLKDTTATSGSNTGPSTLTAAQAAVDSANRAYIAAMGQLTNDIDARAQAQKDLIDQDLKSKTDALQAKIRAIAADDKISNADAVTATASYKTAIAQEKLAAELEKRAVDAKRLNDVADRAYTIQRQQADAQVNILRAQQSMATSEREKARLQQQIDTIEHNLDIAAINLKVQKNQNLANAAVTDGSTAVVVDQGAANQKKAADADFGAKTQKNLEASEGPLAQWVRANQDAAANVQDAYENLIVQGIEGFNDALADSIVNARSFGDAFGSVLKQIAAQLIKMNLTQLETIFSGGSSGGSSSGGFGSVLMSLFGGRRESGGSVSAGQAYVVGEKRPELFIPNSNGRIVPQVAPGIPQGVGRGVVQVFQLHAEGAVMTEDLMSTLNAQARQYAVQATRAGIQQYDSVMPQRVAGIQNDPRRR